MIFVAICEIFDYYACNEMISSDGCFFAIKDEGFMFAVLVNCSKNLSWFIGVSDFL